MFKNYYLMNFFNINFKTEKYFGKKQTMFSHNHMLCIVLQLKNFFTVLQNRKFKFNIEHLA